MRIHHILYINSNQNATSPLTPHGLWTGQVDLTETTECCVSSSMDSLVKCPRYEVREVTLPNWLTPTAWLSNKSGWRYLGGRQVPITDAIDVSKLVNQSAKIHYAARVLLKTKTFRSPIRQSLSDQLRAWLLGDSPYSSPFSVNQLDVILRHVPEYTYKSIDEGIYWNRGYSPFVEKTLSQDEAFNSIIKGESAA